MNTKQRESILRGDIVWVLLDGTKGSEQSGLRPFLILQNDIGNKFSPTTIGAPLSAQISKAKLPTHIRIRREDIHLVEGYDISELSPESDILLEQIRTISKTRIQKDGKIGSFGDKIMKKVEKGLMISLGLSS